MQDLEAGDNFVSPKCILSLRSIVRLSVSSDATFTDLIDAFDELPIAVPPTVENGALIFPAGSSAEV